MRRDGVTRVLYVIACGAPPARHVSRLIEPAQKAGWDVCLLVTPSATMFIDSAALEKLTGHPVRSEYKEPGTPDVLGCIFLTCVTLGRYLINRLKFGVSALCGLTGCYRW